MTDIRNLFQALFDGQMSLAELEQSIEQAAGDPVASQAILQTLDSEFASGRIPTQVYQRLKAKVEAPRVESNEGAEPIPAAFEEQTEIKVQGATPSPAAEDETVNTVQLGPDYLADTRDATRLATTSQDSMDTPVPDETRIGGPAIVGRADTNESTEVAPVSAPPSGLTGSNWIRPDQWTDTATGPIGPGSVINDRFVIESQLGIGGMGIVFKARDRRKEEANDADPYIAIKILNEEFRNHPQSLISLQREATKAQTLAHPNIITVYDFDRDGKTVYMTMELMRGQSLSDYIRNFHGGGAGRDEAVPIIMEMAAGLAYAHKREIVHSDFKPGNVFLTEDSRVKILDFGIARATQRGVADKSSRDQFDAGDLGAMTPGYASFEMLNGEPPDPSDDVYALAVTAYQLLTGEHPFDRKTAQEALIAKMTPRPIKGLRRREWQTIVKGLAFLREERIPNAAQFLSKFRGPTNVIKGAGAAIVSLALIAAYFFSVSLQPISPPFPFEDLSADAQTQFEEFITGGELELTYPPEWRAAFLFFNDAYQIHPRNPKAVAGLDEIANLIVETADRISTRSQKRALQKELEQMFAANEYLEEKGVLLQLHKRLKDEVGP